MRVPLSGSIQFSSVAKLCPTLCDLVNCSTPGLPVLHQLSEFDRTHVHWVSDAIQPSHPLLSPSPALNLSQHQDLFQWVSSSHQMAKVLELQLQHWNHYKQFLFSLNKSHFILFLNNLYSLILSPHCLLFLSLVTEGIYKYSFVTKKKSNNLEVFKVEGNHSTSLNPHLIFSSPELAISLVCIIPELICAFT